MGTFVEVRGGYREAVGKEWPDHRGRRVRGAVYWAPPPPSVGEVVSAYSNQGREGFRLPNTPSQRALGFLVLLAVLVGISTAVTVLVGDGLFQLGLEEHPAPVALAWLLPSTLLLLWLVKPRPQCTYVGLSGISVHKQGPLKTSHQDLVFGDAASLTTEVVRRFTNGVYQGTDYRFDWRSAGGEKLFTHAGTRREPGFSFPMEEDPSWDFALAAEAMWNRHRRPRMEAEMESQGFVAFRVGPGRFLYVSEGKLELEEKSGLTSLPLEKIASLHVEGGCLEIHEVGAERGLLRSRGIHRLPISEVESYTLLLEALERWCDLRLRSPLWKRRTD